MAEILYQHLSLENADTKLLHPIVQEIHKNRGDPVLFERMVMDFINTTDLLPIPKKLAGAQNLLHIAREAAEAWNLTVTVSAHQHCILIEVQLDESRDLTFLCDLAEYADHITLREDPVPVVCIRYFTHGFCRNGEFL